MKREMTIRKQGNDPILLKQKLINAHSELCLYKKKIKDYEEYYNYRKLEEVKAELEEIKKQMKNKDEELQMVDKEKQELIEEKTELLTKLDEWNEKYMKQTKEIHHLQKEVSEREALIRLLKEENERNNEVQKGMDNKKNESWFLKK
ncbi:hypothetical protein [Alkalihalobacillus sp. LMS39]|uniref:hypothetical protein n=1 Tax=Alkalihalobacillus sp. LMS39 TaxID=2924032 RepID=UPI001FB3D48A|nr:hypothetical protein [Alkalihalobacillus sp. LMS39]UOE93129.1 hypothetical protein MM271_18225 [Alkalihalobacillus sp. LMS39]